jgi:hypothetical protein
VIPSWGTSTEKARANAPVQQKNLYFVSATIPVITAANRKAVNQLPFPSPMLTHPDIAKRKANVLRMVLSFIVSYHAIPFRGRQAISSRFIEIESTFPSTILTGTEKRLFFYLPFGALIYFWMLWFALVYFDLLRFRLFFWFEDAFIDFWLNTPVV